MISERQWTDGDDLNYEKVFTSLGHTFRVLIGMATPGSQESSPPMALIHVWSNGRWRDVASLEGTYTPQFTLDDAQWEGKHLIPMERFQPTVAQLLGEAQKIMGLAPQTTAAFDMTGFPLLQAVLKAYNDQDQ